MKHVIVWTKFLLRLPLVLLIFLVLPFTWALGLDSAKDVKSFLDAAMNPYSKYWN